jgi:transcriptional regulator with XRE-family HTH domain
VSDFGKVLRELRETRGLSVNQLAMYSGVSSALISKIETGKRGVPKPDTLEKLSKGLKVPYDTLMELAGYLDNPDLRKKITNDQAKNGVMDIYTRLPQAKRKIIDDMIRALDE